MQRLRVLLFFCAFWAVLPSNAHAQRGCDAHFVQMETLVKRHHVRDYQAHPLDGLPWLRATRWLSVQTRTGVATHTVLMGLAAEAKQAYRIEFANLPAKAQRAVGKAFLGELLDCIDINVDHLQQQPVLLSKVIATLPAAIKSDYLNGQKVLGVYPVAALFAKRSIAANHDESLATFAKHKHQVLSLSRYRHYIPPKTSLLALDPLVARHAPTFIVEQGRSADLLGTPVWQNKGNTLGFAHQQPRVFIKLSHAFWQGQAVRQISYIIWFAGREADGGLDLYAGKLAGLTWRVTVDAQGKALFYDSIHNCGCYQHYFPTRSHVNVNDMSFWEEKPFVPMRLGVLEGRQVGVMIASNTHYIKGVRRVADVAAYGSNANHHVYRYANYDDLRSMPTSNPRRPYKSLFGAGGIVDESERLEQYTLWPFGVPAAGAMRQWGRHATAFIGERYFDDPWLFEYTFGNRALIPDNPHRRKFHAKRPNPRY